MQLWIPHSLTSRTSLVIWAASVSAAHLVARLCTGKHNKHTAALCVWAEVKSGFLVPVGVTGRLWSDCEIQVCSAQPRGSLERVALRHRLSEYLPSQLSVFGTGSMWTGDCALWSQSVVDRKSRNVKIWFQNLFQSIVQNSPLCITAADSQPAETSSALCLLSVICLSVSFWLK